MTGIKLFNLMPLVKLLSLTVAEEQKSIGAVLFLVDRFQVCVQQGAAGVGGIVADAGAAGGAEGTGHRRHPGGNIVVLEGLTGEHGAQMGVEGGNVLHITWSASGQTLRCPAPARRRGSPGSRHSG